MIDRLMKEYNVGKPLTMPNNDSTSPDESDISNTTSAESAVARGAFSTSQDESDSDTSAESAAVARGAARTAATTSTRGIVGRLPVQSSSSSSVGLSVRNIPRLPKRAPRVRASSPPRTTPKIRVPKSHVKVPKSHANTIAKASDRASKGLDLYSSLGDNVNVDNNVTKKSMQIRISRYIQQISSFGKVFITNTVLGMAVFSTYEWVIENVTPPSSDCDDDIEEDVHKQPNLQLQEEQIDKEITEDDMDRATLPQHFLAGGLAGISHSILSLAMDIKKSDLAASKGRTTSGSTANLINRYNFPTFRYSSVYITHHSLAHSVLFGSYQTSKRMCLIKDEENNDSILHIASITMAGGIAGQIQHVTSHLSEQCLGLVNETKNFTSLLQRLKVASLPSFRSTLLSFPPSAIGFLAFEYGKMVMISSDE